MRKVENHFPNRAICPTVIKINMFGMQRGVWRSWLVCRAPSEDAQPCSVPNVAKRKRVQQHGRARTDKLIPSLEGNTVFCISASTLGCHFSLFGQLDGGRRVLNTTGCSPDEGAGEQGSSGQRQPSPLPSQSLQLVS